MTHRAEYSEKTLCFIDPGTTHSAFVFWDGEVIHQKGLVENEQMLNIIDATSNSAAPAGLYIEMVASYGMPVGKTVFQTVLLIGRLIEIGYDNILSPRLVFRKDIKLHHCGQTRAKDSNITQALKDKYGPVSTKAQPNPVYGADYQNKMRKDIWQAFAGATYITESPNPITYVWNNY